MRTFVALIVLTLVSCAAPGGSTPAPEPAWPASGSPADTWVITRTEVPGAGAVLFTLGPAMLRRDGALVRCAFFALERQDPGQGYRIRTYGWPTLDSREPVGGGDGSYMVLPRDGLTWGMVADKGDIVVDVWSLETEG